MELSLAQDQRQLLVVALGEPGVECVDMSNVLSLIIHKALLLNRVGPYECHSP
jgi:hypothetical protein